MGRLMIISLLGRLSGTAVIIITASAFPSYQFRVPNADSVPCPVECGSGSIPTTTCSLVGHHLCTLGDDSNSDSGGGRRTPRQILPSLSHSLGRAGEHLDLLGLWPTTADAGGPGPPPPPPPERSLPLNAFGVDFLSLGGLRWTKSLCQADSDGDGYSNGVELGDRSRDSRSTKRTRARWPTVQLLRRFNHP